MLETTVEENKYSLMWICEGRKGKECMVLLGWRVNNDMIRLAKDKPRYLIGSTGKNLLTGITNVYSLLVPNVGLINSLEEVKTHFNDKITIYDSSMPNAITIPITPAVSKFIQDRFIEFMEKIPHNTQTVYTIIDLRDEDVTEVGYYILIKDIMV